MKTTTNNARGGQEVESEDQSVLESFKDCVLNSFSSRSTIIGEMFNFVCVRGEREELKEKREHNHDHANH